jgi:hypothetical protein
VLELPEAMPWSFFQSAPPEQQIASLTGAEIVVVSGFDAETSGRTRLLPQAPVARCRRDQALANIALRLDTLTVDASAATLSMVWRGVFPLGTTTPGRLDVEVVYATVATPLEAQATAAVDPRLLDAPIAPFLLAARAAKAAAGPVLPGLAAPSAAADLGVAAEEGPRATAAVDVAKVAAPVAPFLLAARRGAGARADLSATPWGGDDLEEPLAPEGGQDETLAMNDDEPRARQVELPAPAGAPAPPPAPVALARSRQQPCSLPSDREAKSSPISCVERASQRRSSRSCPRS